MMVPFKTLWGCCMVVVSVHAFYPDDSSSNPSESNEQISRVKCFSAMFYHVFKKNLFILVSIKGIVIIPTLNWLTHNPQSSCLIVILNNR